KAPCLPEEDSKPWGHRWVPLQQVRQRGHAAFARVRPAGWTSELHLIAEEHDVSSTCSHADKVRQRYLPRFVDEQMVEPSLGFRAGKRPGRAADYLGSIGGAEVDLAESA